MNDYCSKCGCQVLSSAVVKFSRNKFNRIICFDCQRIPTEPQTPQEKALFQALKKRGLHVISQKWDGYKTIDLTIPEAKVNIEVDGLQHGFDKNQALIDLKRTYHSFKKDWLTLRIPNVLVTNHLDETADVIVAFINKSVDQLEDDDLFY